MNCFSALCFGNFSGASGKDFLDDADVDGDADVNSDADADADADSLPLHGIPIPPEPCEIGNCDRPKRGVSEEVIQCVPDQQVLVNITAITKHS